MKLTNLLSIAIRAIWRNKSRSVLTMLGVIIGVGAVILLISIGNGLQSLVTEQFEDFGANNIFVSPGNPFGEGGGFNPESQEAALLNNKLQYSDAQEIRRLREVVSGVSALAQNQAQTTYKDTTKLTTIIGTDAEYSQLTNTVAQTGEFYTQAQADKSERVAVLGSKIAEELFGSIDPIGKNIILNGLKFKVIGVAEEKGGGFGGPSFDNYVYIPINTFFNVFDSTTIGNIYVQAKNSNSIPETIRAVEELLSKRLDEDEFSVYEQTEILDVINQILGGLTAGLGGIAAISLLVGGIGIMNIMLVSVTERTREVGLRKALGATPRVILLQFLIEAVVLSFFGGLIGVLFAFAGSLAISQFIPAKLTLSSVLLAFGVSATVGIIFGVYPARKASKLSPIEALRYE